MSKKLNILLLIFALLISTIHYGCETKPKPYSPECEHPGPTEIPPPKAPDNDLEVFDSLADPVTAETLKQIADLAIKKGCDKELVQGWIAERELYLGINENEVPLEPNILDIVAKRIKNIESYLEKICVRSNEVIETIRKNRTLVEDQLAADSNNLTLSPTDPIFFHFNSWTIEKDIDLTRIGKIAKSVVKSGSPVVIIVEGHADAIGSYEKNFLISKLRAESVVKELIENGLSKENIRTIAYGNTQMIMPGHGGNTPGAEKNRRVSFSLEFLNISK